MLPPSLRMLEEWIPAVAGRIETAAPTERVAGRASWARKDMVVGIV